MRWQVHGSREIYNSPWVKLRIDDVELPSGARVDHHVIDFPKPSAGAIVVDQLGRLLLLWRHRHITDASGWEFPAGWVEPGEDPRDAIAREILEETGYQPGHIEQLMTYHPLSGISSMTYTVFLAVGAVRLRQPEVDETERVKWFTIEDARTLLRSGQIVDGPSLNAVSYYLATRST